MRGMKEILGMREMMGMMDMMGMKWVALNDGVGVF